VETAKKSNNDKQMKGNSQPIGIFDSGAGGLTVASAVKSILPTEKIIYFGDTLHLPYGDKSTEAIRHYSVDIANFLISKNVKVILIACNTASAAAYKLVKEHVKGKVPVVNVIDPAVEFVTRNSKFQNIGIIGTKATVQSESYPIKIKTLSPTKNVTQLAAPLLVPMIEEGFIYDNISNEIIKSYLSSEELATIDSLILGCTHYPIIKNQIRKFFNFKTTVIDSSQIVAEKLRQVLTTKQLLSKETTTPEHEFYVSDYTDFFKTLAEMFFEEEITVTQKNIWEKGNIIKQNKL